MIEKVKLSNLRNSEFIEFFKTLIQLIEGKSINASRVKEKLNELILLVKQVDGVFKPELGSKLTGKLQEIDTERDNLIAGIDLIIEGYCHHFDSALKMKAELLWNSLRTYGTGIQRLGYQEETQVLDNLSQRWLSTSELTDALVSLNLFDWVNEIKKQNDLFRANYIDRVDTDASQLDIRAIDLRKQIAKTYDDLNDLLQAYAIIGDEPTYGQVINSSNELIGKYNQLLKNRSASQEETPVA